MNDPHAGENGSYIVRSLYLDDLFDACLQDNLRGANPRSKFRLRRYNGNKSFLKLEKKIKQSGVSIKESCVLSLDECRAIMNGEIPTAKSNMEPLKQRLLTEVRLRGLLPKTIVTYQRYPFEYPAGNVRVTFDRALTYSSEINRFLEEDYVAFPVMRPEEAIMEVKWTEVMPAHIRGALQSEELIWEAFSKYTVCRLVQRQR